MQRFALATLLLLAAAPVLAQSREAFGPGPVLADVGPIAPVDSDVPIPKGSVFKIAFDVSDKATPGELSRRIETAARALNMHVAAGVPQKDVHIVVIVHGPASNDLLIDAAYGKRNDGKPNASGDAREETDGCGC